MLTVENYIAVVLVLLFHYGAEELFLDKLFGKSVWLWLGAVARALHFGCAHQFSHVDLVL